MSKKKITDKTFDEFIKKFSLSNKEMDERITLANDMFRLLHSRRRGNLIAYLFRTMSKKEFKELRKHVSYELDYTGVPSLEDNENYLNDAEMNKFWNNDHRFIKD